MKSPLLVILRGLLIFVLAAPITFAIHWTKPYTQVAADPSDFVVLAQDESGVTTAKFISEERCAPRYGAPGNLPPAEHVQIGNSDYFYSLASSQPGTSEIRIRGGVYGYDYKVSDGCVTPVQSKLFSSWEMLIGFALSTVLVLLGVQLLQRWRRA